MIGFQCEMLPSGDILVADGAVCDPRNGVVLQVGTGNIEFLPNASMLGTIPMRQASGHSFVGGSGRNLIVSGLPASPSGAPDLQGFYQPTRPGIWVSGSFVLRQTGETSAVLEDATDVVANFAGGTLPAGTYTATEYGEDTYNGGTAFSLTVARENWPAGAVPNITMQPTISGLPAGTLEPVSEVSWTLADPAGWSVTVAADGTAEISDGTDVVATRAADSAWMPDGRYEATAYGKSLVSGADFGVWIATVPRAPMAGFVYLTVSDPGGVLTAVDGPFFAAALPANSTGTTHVPLARVDASGASEQYHTGLLMWHSPGTAGPAGTGKTWVPITMANYELLTPAEMTDPDTVYDILDYTWT